MAEDGGKSGGGRYGSKLEYASPTAVAKLLSRELLEQVALRGLAPGLRCDDNTRG